MASTQYTVKTPVFEGPLDLLLDLVSKRKLFINDVSLAQVTDDFIAYLEDHKSLGSSIPIGESAEFLVVASTLMLVKSRSLLPTLELTEEEEESISDLEERLRLYARTKELANGLGKIFGREVIFEKLPKKNVSIIFSPDTKTDLDNLLSVLKNLINTLPKEEKLSKATVKKVVSLEEMIGRLAERISKASRMSFRDFSGQGHSGELTPEKKVSIIVSFLAMLELVKRGAIRVSQESKGDIEIESDSVGLPTYG